MAEIDPFPFSLYCGLVTDRSLDCIAKALTKRGWESRMCSWTEHELTCDHAELILMPHDPPLLSGGIAPTTDGLDRVLCDLRAIDIGGDYELYNERNELLAEGPIAASEDHPANPG